MFSDEIMDSVYKLRRKYAGLRYYVVVNFPVVEVIKLHDKKEISVKLYYHFETDSFEIQSPNGIFYSHGAHYDYRTPERHWIRNKKFLFSLIRDLQESGLWEYVSNKDFLVLNTYVTRAPDKAKLINDLNKILKSEPPPGPK